MAAQIPRPLLDGLQPAGGGSPMSPHRNLFAGAGRLVSPVRVALGWDTGRLLPPPPLWPLLARCHPSLWPGRGSSLGHGGHSQAGGHALLAAAQAAVINGVWFGPQISKSLRGDNNLADSVGDFCSGAGFTWNCHFVSTAAEAAIIPSPRFYRRRGDRDHLTGDQEGQGSVPGVVGPDALLPPPGGHPHRLAGASSSPHRLHLPGALQLPRTGTVSIYDHTQGGEQSQGREDPHGGAGL